MLYTITEYTTVPTNISKKKLNGILILLQTEQKEKK